MKPYKDWKIRFKILFSAIIPFIIALIFAAPFIVRNSLDDAEFKTRNYMDEVGYGTALVIESEIKYIFTEVDVIFRVLQPYAMNIELNKKYINRMLQQILLSNPNCNEIAVIMKDGERIKVSNSEVHYDINTSFDECSKDKCAYLLPEYEKGRTSSINIFKKNSEFYIFANFKIPALDSVVMELKDYNISHVSLFDSHGTEFYQKLFGARTKMNLSGHAANSVKNKSYITFNLFDEEMGYKTYNVFSPIHFSDQPSADWTLYISYPLLDIYSTIYKNLKFTLMILACALFIGISVSLVTARNIATPITSISIALENIANGRYNYQLPEIDNSDEIGQMMVAAKIFKQKTYDLSLAKQEAEAANVAKTEFLANMSHELRTPMHAMLGYAKLGLERVSAEEVKLKKYFTNIFNSGERLLKLLNDLLDLSKLESGKMQFSFMQKDVVDILKQVIDELKSLISEKHLKINIIQNCPSSIAAVDEMKIIQVFVNILSNAIKFSPQNSNIDIIISDSMKSANLLEISINDEGIGIPESEVKAIFDKFIQSSKTNQGAGGTGLGLAIVRNIVSAHHGKVWAENRKDRKGAAFKILLPKVMNKEDVNV